MDKIKHKVIIKLNEIGVQATAATCASVFKSMSKPIEAPRCKIDYNKHFKIFIIHNETNSILFETNIVVTPSVPKANCTF